MSTIGFFIAGAAIILLAVFLYTYYDSLRSQWRSRMRRNRRSRIMINRAKDIRQKSVPGINASTGGIPANPQAISDRIGINSTIL